MSLVSCSAVVQTVTGGDVLADRAMILSVFAPKLTSLTLPNPRPSKP